MKNNLTWLSISLFCCKNEWNRLFADGIAAFIIANDFSKAYTLEFNYIGGENIRLSLLTGKLNINQLTKKSREYFKAWFLKANLIVPEVMPVEESVSLPFPANSIQFGLYHREEKENQSLVTSLSQIILDVLKADLIDDETILTFAFYLQICLIKVITKIDPTFINTLKPKFKYTKPDNIENDGTGVPAVIKTEPMTEDTDVVNSFIMDRISLYEKFEEYKKGLVEITGDIMNGVNEADILQWLKQWLDTCRAELNEPVDKGDIAISYKRIIDTVYRHLGITPEIGSMLAYFVQRVFGLMNPPSVIIMGAQKCGTSTLHRTLAAHSNINWPFIPRYNLPTKEVNFFGNPENWKKGLDWYFSHFSGPRGMFLDSSPNYLISTVAFKRMCKIVPDAKLVICIRNPVKRAYSHYNHYKQILPRSEKWDWIYDKDFLTNIKTELNAKAMSVLEGRDVPDSETSFPGLVLRGVYIKQIKELLKYYDRSQIYITVTDWWPHNYESEVNNIQAFLGLEIEALSPRIANKREYEEPINEEARQLLTEFYKLYNQELFEFLGYEIPEWD